jgi:CRP-like cAMP-binding protein
MDLSGRFSRWRDSARRPLSGPRADTGGSRVDGDNQVKLTVGGRRFKVQVEMARPGRTESAGHGSAAADGAVVQVDEVCADQSITHQAPVPADGTRANELPLGAPVYTGGSAAGPRYPRPSEYTDSRDLRPHGAATGFWDVLDPIEREALRSVASWRTFAAGARIMEEGERADHVMVILGGQVEIRVDENGREQVVAVRGLGQLVGERAALTVSVRSATVVALEMVWALVVQTKDFAAFISTHPRVLDIVQNQQYQRRAEGAPGYQEDDYPDDFPAEQSGGLRTASRSGTTYAAEYSRKSLQRLNGENCTVFLTDVVDFGARTRTDGDRLIIREALFRMTQTAMQVFPDSQSEDRGDGLLTAVPPSVSTVRVFYQLLNELPAALGLHNSIQRESARFKLRLAVNVGPVTSHMNGVSGEAIIVAARLVEAPDFKRALAGSTAGLGLIASPFVYETVVRHGSDPREMASYAQVPVEVKETETTAWMKLFGAPETSLNVSHPGAPGSHAGH